MEQTSRSWEHMAYYRRMVERAAPELGPARLAAVLQRLGLPGRGAAVCHGDMHPANVIMAQSGPIVIDWLTAGSGPPEADLARTRFLLIESVVPDAYPRLQRLLIDAVRRRFARTYLRHYRRLRPIDEQQLDLWRVPVLAARINEAIEGEHDQLLASIDSELARPGIWRSGTALPPP